MVVLSGTSSELFSKISLTSAGIMSTWFLIKLLWLQANIRFKLINLQNSVKGTETALTRGDALN